VARLSRAIVLAAGTLAAGEANALAPQVPTFPSEVELVTVDVVVVDGKGQPVSGLTRDDFTLAEDGRPLEIASFEAFDEPAAPGVSTPPAAPGEVAAPVARPARSSGGAFGILLDDVWIPPILRSDVRDAVTSFLKKSVRDGDEVTLGSTSGKLWWSARIPEGRDDLLAVLARFQGDFGAEAAGREEYVNPHLGMDQMRGGSLSFSTMSEYQAFLIVEGRADGDTAMARLIEGRRRARMGRTLAAVSRMLNALATVRGRKSLLLLTQGFLQDSEPQLRQAASASREANTAIYFMDVRGLRTASGYGASDVAPPPAASRVGLQNLEDNVLATAGTQDLADDTGGFSVRNTNDLGRGADRIAVESRAFYLLGFHPPSGKAPGEWRKLRVEVKRSGVKARARRGYSLRGAAGVAKAPKEERTASLAVEGALDSAHDVDGIPMRAMAYVFEPRGKDGARVVVAAELDAGKLSRPGNGKAGRSTVEASVLATDRDTGRTTRSDGRFDVPVVAGESPGWRSLALELELPAGVSQIRVVVRDPATGAIGSAAQRFEVPHSGALRLSTPIITDTAGRAEGNRGRPRPALAAHRVFPPAGRLYCEFEVFGAARPPGGAGPRVAAGLELRTADGRTVRQSPLTPIAADPDGRLVRLVEIGLDGMAEGSYELVLDVRDEVGDGRLERREPFRLAR
jgi:VWFA-related protein